MATSALDRRPRNDRPRWTARQSDSWLPLFRYRIAWRKPPSQPQSFLLERFRTGSNPARVGRVRTSRSLSGGVFEDLDHLGIEPPGNIRRRRFRKFGEECGDLVQVDAGFFAVALGDADTHRCSKAGGAGEAEQTVTLVWERPRNAGIGIRRTRRPRLNRADCPPEDASTRPAA
jgi:hypothetical protein